MRTIYNSDKFRLNSKCEEVFANFIHYMLNTRFVSSLSHLKLQCSMHKIETISRTVNPRFKFIRLSCDVFTLSTSNLINLHSKFYNSFHLQVIYSNKILHEDKKM